MLAAMQSAQCKHHALPNVGPRTANVVAHRNARPDHVIIGERTHGHLLPDPVRGLPRGERSDLALLALRSTPRPLEPPRAVEAGIPDVSDAHGPLRAGVEVPVLPIQKRALRHGWRARERERTSDHRRGRDERKPAWSFGQAGKQNEHDRQDHHSAAELAAPCQQRRRPACADEEEHDGEDDATGSDGERDHEGEREDRDQKHVVHMRVRRGIDRQAVVVEVQETAAEPRAERAEVALPSRPQRLRGDGERDPDRKEPCDRKGDEAEPERSEQDRSDREQDEHERPTAARTWFFEPQPVDGDHQPSETGNYDRPKHGPPRASLANALRGHRRRAPPQPPRRPRASARARAPASGPLC